MVSHSTRAIQSTRAAAYEADVAIGHQHTIMPGEAAGPIHG